MRRLAAFLTFCLVLLVGASGWAGVAERLGLTVKGNVQGDAQPKLTFTPTEDVRSLTVTLWRDGQRAKIHRALGAVKKGTTRELTVRQPKGKFHYKTKIEVVWRGKKRDTLRIQFDLTRSGGFSLEIDPEEVDLDARTLQYAVTQRAKRAELRLFDEADKSLGVVKQALAGEAPGSKQRISWPALERPLAYMKLRAWSEAGFWTEMRLEPVSLRIPHQDVAFDTGRANIKKSEEPKLRDTLAKLREALKMQAQTIGVRLYVAGYCDTVGPAAQNKTLSRKRARSIALWFRGHGVKLPIFYQGFGEDALRVKTPDETPEPRNRRAVYLLSTHTPGKSADFPTAAWTKL